MLLYILFALGFVFLIKGADMLVSGASSVAKRFNISDMVVGLTIVSFGTSLPELIINIMSSMQGQSELAIGNVFGSNVANLLLIIGVTAIICPLPIQRNTILTEIPFSLIATLLVGFLANAVLFGDKTSLFISRVDGGILLFFFVLFMAYIYNIAKTNKDEVIEEDDEPMMSIPKSVLYMVLGGVGLFLGGKWVVDGAVSIAQSFGLSESFIGLTIVAIGTSLPELVTSAMAAFRRNIDIAIGNVIGSNIFNLLWILGISAVINPLPFNVVSNSDIMVMIFASTLLVVVIPIGKKNTIDRWNGIFFLAIYVAYIVFLIQRG
ncbi:calcium/sodium antiporter [Pontibacter sp. FD36]|uniref:Cation:H+ antiporter n=1 Tax=Pontibacter lucknowensis TaxID=1077936 RepID=A0A1N6T227_9BACT|nr:MULTISPECIES: calcium/sodium antiporter [Pontibacter]MBF8962023.1 calcium/sodium antiporter [Pontibacter sp. FD36]SIQ47277.1 cation:H+ antiporter [Pontibacter lucknowensis]